MTVPVSRGDAPAASMDVPAYLARLDYSGPLTPSAATLRALHRAHLFSVPFENLDISRGRRLSLARPALFDKIVTRRRGGFCYELNGLFGWLLESLGYSVTYLSARVYGADGGLSPEFDHLALWVEPPAGGPGERWLADVGFGDSFVEPLRLAAGFEETQGLRTYGLVEHDGGWDYWQREPDAEPARQYAFSLQPRQFPADFEAMCIYQQTAPESHFTQHRLCTLATPTGRISLSDRRWIVTEHGARHESPIDDAEFERLCQTRFGVVLPGD